MANDPLAKKRRILAVTAILLFLVIIVLTVILITLVVSDLRASSGSRKASASSSTQTEESSSDVTGESSETSSALQEDADESGDSNGSADSDASDSSADSSETADSSESSVEESSAEEPSAPFAVETVTKSEDDIHRGILQLVNKETKYEFLDDWLIPMHDLDHYGYVLDEDDDYTIEMAEPAAVHMNDFLNTFYDTTGIWNLYLMNGYRSPEDADYLFQRSAEQNGLEHALKYVMQAGYSEHHIGCSTDVGMMEGGPYFEASEDSEYYWIYEHAADYGFILRYPEDKEDITEIGYESWHFRYVSVSVANYMYANDLCLEEFEDLIKNYSVTDPLEVEVTQGPEPGDYLIYYQEGTEVPVPAEMEYTISGNNVDGFIVIVKMD